MVLLLLLYSPAILLALVKHIFSVYWILSYVHMKYHGKKYLVTKYCTKRPRQQYLKQATEKTAEHSHLVVYPWGEGAYVTPPTTDLWRMWTLMKCLQILWLFGWILLGISWHHLDMPKRSHHKKRLRNLGETNLSFYSITDSWRWNSHWWLLLWS